MKPSWFIPALLCGAIVSCDDDEIRTLPDGSLDPGSAGDFSYFHDLDVVEPDGDNVDEPSDPGPLDTAPDLPVDAVVDTVLDKPQVDTGSALGEPCDQGTDCAGELRCDPESKTCVNCLTSQDCGAGTYCKAGHCVDWECVPGSKFCEETVLATCSQEGDGPVGHLDCDDQNPCTEGDTCQGTGCVQGNPVDCDDGNGCTQDSCDTKLGCVHTPAIADCDDGNPCTPVDQCVGISCIGSGELNCDDANPCTDDLCDALVGCRHVPNEQDCDIDDPCSLAQQCLEGLCSILVPVDCDDGDPCTEDQCNPASGQCQQFAIPECGPCVLDSHCDDDNSCSVDSCLNGQCVHSASPNSECCTTAAQCDDGDPCTDDTCETAPLGICANSPIAGEGCCDPVVHWVDFSQGDAQGFLLDPPQESGVGWHLVETSHASSPPWALYYGNPDAGNYDSGQSNEGSALGPEVTLPAGVELTLRFQTWQDVEKAVNLDYLSLEASTTARDYPIWQKPPGFSMKLLETVVVDISALQARSVRFRLTFRTMDELVNDLEGVYVDDIEVFSPCDAKPCFTDLDCWSIGLGGTCLDGACDFTQVLGPLLTFGSYGTEPGQFDNPFGVAVTPEEDRVFVSDKAHHRIQVFDSKGAFLKTYGSFGSNPGHFYQPHGLASSSDRLYVADTQNHRIQVFTHSGVFLFEFGGPGEDGGSFNQPKDVGLSQDDEVLYVADTSNHRIQAFGEEGGFLFEFGTYGKGVGQMRSPSCVLVTPDFDVLVCDTQNHRILRFAFDGTYLDSIKPVDEWALYYPYGAALRSDGFLAVADSYHHRIQVLEPSGLLWDAFGSSGPEPDEFNYPMGLAFGPSGNLYVVDAQNDRVVVFGYSALP